MYRPARISIAQCYLDTDRMIIVVGDVAGEAQRVAPLYGASAMIRICAASRGRHPAHLQSCPIPEKLGATGALRPLCTQDQ
jgi:hypothetical protein